jgi:hypothetical protein
MLLCTRDLWTLGRSARRSAIGHAAALLDEFHKLDEYHLTERNTEKVDDKLYQNVTS